MKIKNRKKKTNENTNKNPTKHLKKKTNYKMKSLLLFKNIFDFKIINVKTLILIFKKNVFIVIILLY